jgi:hypothetical protein
MTPEQRAWTEVRDLLVQHGLFSHPNLLLDRSVPAPSGLGPEADEKRKLLFPATFDVQIVRGVTALKIVVRPGLGEAQAVRRAIELLVPIYPLEVEYDGEPRLKWFD